ncbi:MAG: sporulation protein Cse60 [Chlorobi bacterium]|nr:sporulation protein Cse60 [Chlorobiota bacterium]
MEKLLTKHFQYTGTDDYDTSLDEQINAFIKKEGISVDDLVDIKYSGHSSEGVNTYSALLVYRK